MAETRDISYYRQLPYRRIVDLIEDDDQGLFRRQGQGPSMDPDSR